MVNRSKLKRGVEAFVVLGQRKGGQMALQTLREFLPKSLVEDGRVCDLPEKGLDKFIEAAESKAFDRNPK